MKKNLFIIRHAKSSWKGAGQINDIDRPLNLRGTKAAIFMSNQMYNNYQFDKIYSSSAFRTLNTANIFIREMYLNYDILDIKNELYHASSNVILDVLKLTNNKKKSVALFAHNPGINDFVFKTGQDIPNVVTTGIIHYQYEGEWADLDFSQLEFISYNFPKKK